MNMGFATEVKNYVKMGMYLITDLLHQAFGKTVFFISDSQLPKYFLRYIGKVFTMTEFLSFFMSDYVFRVF